MIGIFDSGTGGLSIYRAIKRLVPEISCLYYADHAHFPYGKKTVEEINAYAYRITEFLIEKGARIIVVACNTATIASIKYLRNCFDIPFVGTVPAIKPACMNSKSRKVAVLLTQTASKGNVFHELVSSWSNHVEVICIRSSRLVEISEHQNHADTSSSAYLRQLLDPLVKKDVDSLVLGSTHFIFLKDWIEQLYPHRFSIYDPSEGVARQTQRIVNQMKLKNSTSLDLFFTSGTVESFALKIKFLDFSDIPAFSIYQAPLGHKTHGSSKNP